MNSLRLSTGRHRQLGATAVAAVAAATLTACSGTSCDELPALQAEREQRRAAYLKLAESGARPEQTGTADAALHDFERHVYNIEQSCTSR